MSDEHLPIFVYGTLKRGECREPNWPRPAVRIERATTRGKLYDLGPYPAMIYGPDIIDGELWYVTAEDLKVTLAALDEIECFGNDNVDLYVREIVQCRVESGSIQRAHAYFLASPQQLADRDAIAPDHDGRCRWNAQPESE